MYYRHLVSVGFIFYLSCGHMNVKLIRLCYQRDVNAFTGDEALLPFICSCVSTEARQRRASLKRSNSLAGDGGVT